MTLGKRLKELREEKDKTQQEIADILGVGRATIAGYETKGKQPDHSKLKQLADYFGVSLDYLLGRTDFKYTDIEEKRKVADAFMEMLFVTGELKHGEKLTAEKRQKILDKLRRFIEASRM